MLLSMTGFGEAHSQDANLAVVVEVRAINNRHFKLTPRLGENYSFLEPQVEELVRQSVRRGTIQVALRVDRAHRPDDFKLNTDVLAGYRRQLSDLQSQWGLSRELPLEALLALPGVVEEHTPGADEAQADWPIIRKTLEAALERLTAMRRHEGEAMAADLAMNCREIAAELDVIVRRAPLVAQGYRERLVERINRILSEHGVTVQPADIVREAAVFAERSDISEETVRLRSHLDQVLATLAQPESNGRKLEFLTQEMVRETNTIGSKSNDIDIAHRVVEIKGSLERIREMIQNVE
jgi:uncharacterized protein (TIGR00255 family)